MEEFSRRQRDLDKTTLQLTDTVTLEMLKEPLSRIVEDLGEKIERGEYTLIIGDDASGCIPALMMGTIIRDIYEGKQLPHKLPIMRFFAGSTHLESEGDMLAKIKRSDLREQLGKVKDTMVKLGLEPHKALIVTDTILSGSSVRELVVALRSNGIEADVAACSFPDKYTDMYGDYDPNSNKYAEAIHRLEREWGAQIAIGYDAELPIYQSNLSGVVKNTEDVYATPNAAQPERIRAGRAFAKRIAHEIAAEYLSERRDED